MQYFLQALSIRDYLCKYAYLIMFKESISDESNKVKQQIITKIQRKYLNNATPQKHIIINYLQYIFMPHYQNHHKIKIISSAWANNILEFSCPVSWNINQIKCYIIHIYPRIQFNQFQLTLSGHLMEGNQKLCDILENRKNRQNLTFFVIFRQSEKFQDYYHSRMKKFEERIEDQFYDIIGGQQENQLLYIPILNNKFQSFLKNQNNPKKVIPEVPLNQNAPPIPEPQVQQQQNVFDRIIGLLRYFLLYTILSLLYYNATYQQIGLILLVAFVHYLVEAGGRRRDIQNNNNNVNNNPLVNNGNMNINNNLNNEVGLNEEKEDANKNENSNKRMKKIKIQKNGLKRMVYRYQQLIYCFLFSLFPNWSIQNYLQQNKNQIQNRQAQLQEQVLIEDQQIKSNNQQIKKEN